MAQQHITSGITSRMIQQVAAKRYRFGDPCIICGDIKFDDRRCPHSFGEVQRIIQRIRSLTDADKVFIARREESEKQLKSKDELETQADELVAKAEEMLAAAKELRKEASTRYEYPDEPAFTYAALSVKFRGGYSTYKYALFMPRKGGPIFTTGQQEETHKFANWKALVDWLRSDDVVWNSDVDQLIASGQSVKVP